MFLTHISKCVNSWTFRFKTFRPFLTSWPSDMFLWTTLVCCKTDNISQLTIASYQTEWSSVWRHSLGAKLRDKKVRSISIFVAWEGFSEENMSFFPLIFLILCIQKQTHLICTQPAQALFFIHLWVILKNLSQESAPNYQTCNSIMQQALYLVD